MATLLHFAALYGAAVGLFVGFRLYRLIVERVRELRSFEGWPEPRPRQ